MAFVLQIVVGRPERGELLEGSLLEWDADDQELEAGARVPLRDRHDQVQQVTVDRIGNLIVGGRPSPDIVADITTLEGRRYGLRRSGVGVLGSLWVIVGRPFEDRLAVPRSS